MPETEQREIGLLQQFQQFCQQLNDLKHSAKSGTWVYSSEEHKKKDQAGRETTTASSLIYQKLVSLFETQQVLAAKTGGDMGSKLYRDALFIMTAMADEIFLTMDWMGQDAWSRFLLETKFFGSNAGGDIFFLKLDTVLKERDPVYTEIAIMFLLALSFGFRGKFHGINDAGAINQYKDQLYLFVFQEPPLLDVLDKKLFPEAYRHTLEQDAKTVLPGLKKWYGWLALLAFSLLGISHIIWIHMTGDIVKIVTQIQG